MTQYIIRRLAQMIPITFGILTLVFSLIHLIPGDPAVQIAGENARPQDVQQVRHSLGLDQPLGRQYVTYLRNICLLYTSPSPRDTERSRMPSSA